jgi:hypothetical protein
MTEKKDAGKNANLTLVKGGRLSAGEFAALPFAEKLEHLRGVGAKRRMDLLLADPEARQLVRAFPPQEMFRLVKEIGEVDALELIHLASPEQVAFFLDLELWEKWSLSRKKALQWLGHIVEGGEEFLRELLPELDLELLLLILEKEIAVGGGLGELAPDEERLTAWDHTFDNVYFITFRDKKHSRLIGSFIDTVYRIDHSLYLALMEGGKNEVGSDLEELALRFRAGRLADQGFPELDEALTIYARLDPAAFVPAGDRVPLAAAPAGGLSILPAGGDSLLQRVLAQAHSEELGQELNYLVNCALVADAAAFADAEAMQTVLQRVYGCLTIALEFLSGGDEAKALEIVRGEYLKRLFQLGWNILRGLQEKAEGIASDDYATGKALAGLRTRHPRFYRALDPDGVDGYREFRNMEDVRKMEELLKKLMGS